MHRSILVAAIALLVPLAEASAEQKLMVASGHKGQTYHDVYARNLAKHLNGYSVQVRKTTGSAENLDLLSDGKVDVAFAQADVFALRMEEEPDLFGTLRILGTVAEECVYVAYRREGRIRTLQQFAVGDEENPAKMAIGAYGGGMADTWNYLVTLLPGLAEVDIEYKGGKAELTQMTFGAYDAVGWVTDPTNLNHAMLTAVRANENLALMDFDDPSLGSELPDGRSIYEIKDVSVDADSSKPKLKTVCTTALLFARPDVDEALAKKLSAVVGLGVLRQ